MASFFDYSFVGPVDRFGVGKTRKVWYTVLFLPAELREALPFDQYPRLRVDGEVNDVPLEGAFIPTGDGRNYVILNPKLLKATGLTLGDMAEMRFRIDDQDRVDVPQDLAAALNRDPDVKALWDALTPGKKRGIAYSVDAAKRRETGDKRIAAAFDAIVNNNGNLMKR